MNETIGTKGGYNDRRRMLIIKKRKKNKLKEYEETKKNNELEEKGKRKQFITLIKNFPIILFGRKIKSLNDNSKKNNGNYNYQEKKDKVIKLPDGKKVIVNIPKQPGNNESKLEEILHLNKCRKENIKEADKKVTIKPSDTSDFVELDIDLLPKEYKTKIEKLKSHKIVDVYEKKLKDVRYELRHLVYEYSVLETDNDKLIISSDAQIMLDKLSKIIAKLDELKNKIAINDIDKYDDNYIYYLVESYLLEFGKGRAISDIKDSPLYIEISKKINELEARCNELSIKILNKAEKEKNKEKKLYEFENEYYDIDKINNDLLNFQYEQDRVLKDLKDKVANATSVTEKVEYETKAMSEQSKILLGLLGFQLFLPGPMIAKKMAFNTAAYLYFMNNILRPKTTSKKYKVIQVKNYSTDIENSIFSLDSAINMLEKTSIQVDKMIERLSDEFKDYLGIIPEVQELVDNLYKIKNDLEEKEYEIYRIKKEQEKVLVENNDKVLKKNDNNYL